MERAISIREVRDEQDLQAFLRFPLGLYRDEPMWLAPPPEERSGLFDQRQNPFLEHARSQSFIALRDGAVVGTITAVVDDFSVSFHQEQMGVFGFFESVDDQQVAEALLAAAEGWARDQGMALLRGPLNFSTNYEAGLLIHGHDQPPMLMMPFQHRYYAGLIEGCGYRKAMDLYAYGVELEPWLATQRYHAFSRGAQRLAGGDIRVRAADPAAFEREAAIIAQIYLQVWSSLWGFAPMSPAEFAAWTARLREIADPELVLIAENAAGEPVGMQLTLPDTNQALRRAEAVDVPADASTIDQARIVLLGILAPYRQRGVGVLLLDEVVRRAHQRGYRRLEGSWILETNQPTNHLLRHMGWDHTKTYRIYERALL